jgi:hypothetical protein
MSARRAVVLTAVIWALWHVPFQLSGIQHIDGVSPVRLAVGFPLGIVAAGLVLGWLWLHTESVWLCWQPLGCSVVRFPLTPAETPGRLARPSQGTPQLRDTHSVETMQARMRQMSPFAVVVGALVVLLGGTTLAQSNDSEVGIWKLNVAKSTFSSGTALKSATAKVEAAGAGVKTTADLVFADGTVRHSEYTVNYDGKDSPVTGNNQNGDTVARTRINTTTTKQVYKKGGKITVTLTGVVSGDGKTLTLTTTGTNALGQTVNNVSVYDKQ